MFSKRKLPTLSLLIFLVLAACTLQEPKITQTTVSKNEQLLFSRLIALGDNIISGYQNAALTAKHQKFSFPALLARQGHTPNFQQPLIAYPGLGPDYLAHYGTLELRYLDDPNTPNSVTPDPVIYAVSFSDTYLDMPFVSKEVMNYPGPYSNLGIPGIVLKDVLKGKTQLHSTSKSPMIDVILRNPWPDPYGELSPFDQAKLFHPSLIICWAGLYDVLGYAQFNASGQAFSEPTSAEDFSKYYSALMDSLLSLGAGGVIVGNIPDILDMPYFNIVPSVVIDSTTNAPYLDNNGNPIPLLGVNEGDRVLMPVKRYERQGLGIPEGVLNGKGEAIPADMILDPDEAAVVKTAIDDYNAIIDSVCSKRNIPVVDMYSFFKQVQDTIDVTGIPFSGAFISGGFYSLDGVHPGDLGHALIANQWLQTINAHFHTSLPEVNIVELADELQHQPPDTVSTALP